MFDVAVSCLVLTALFAYINHRYVRLPTTIGVMVIALLLSLALLVLDKFGIGVLRDYEVKLLESLDFSTVLMEGMLSLLLFAGALQIDIHELRSQSWKIAILAVFGTAASTVLVGLALWALLPLVSISLPLEYCLLFGALISPTDPVAVMGILKSAGAPRDLEVTIAGESLFNDGVGVVLFMLLLETLEPGGTPTLRHGLAMLAREAGGGLAFGFVLGYVIYRMLKSIDQYQVEILITLAAVMGGYALANRLHVSGPLAMVVVGIFIGNHGRTFAMSERTRDHLDAFWELLDELLNAILFVLLGLEVTLITIVPGMAYAVLLTLTVTLVARTVSVGLPVAALPGVFRVPRGGWQILVWGGLRVASRWLWRCPCRRVKTAPRACLTYAVVVFSIVCQGATLEALTRRALAVKG